MKNPGVNRGPSNLGRDLPAHSIVVIAEVVAVAEIVSVAASHVAIMKPHIIAIEPPVAAPPDPSPTDPSIPSAIVRRSVTTVIRGIPAVIWIACG